MLVAKKFVVDGWMNERKIFTLALWWQMPLLNRFLQARKKATTTTTRVFLCVRVFCLTLLLHE